MNDVFPKVKHIEARAASFKLCEKIRIYTECDDFSGICEYFADLANSLIGVSAELCSENADIVIQKAELKEEGYILDVSANGVKISASDNRGAMYAASTLVQLIEKSGDLSIPACRIEDSPYAEVRGVHLYLPSRENIEAFKRIIDVMAFLKMNTVIIEVGGGMEYDLHPEINTAWERFCHQMDEEFPGHGKSRSLQGSDIYWKDSIHTEHAGGSYLKKSEVRELVEYCKSRYMEVIPEIQALSHAYYLCIAHPEIAEMQDDPFPDTYCPNNEKSYELYFDVAEEIIEVFEPKTVSIGHDEIRVLGWCDKCKDKTGHELVGKDILRLHEFYKKKGIRIAMWGESAQTFESYTGDVIGANDVSRTNKYGHYYHLSATYKSLEMLPSDILMLDWYHSLGYSSEDCFMERGIDVIYGNFHGSQFGEWEVRSRKKCIKGAEVSTWCVTDEPTFAKDGIFFEMCFSAYILWNSEYTNSDFADVCRESVSCAAYLRTIMRGERSAVFSGGGSSAIYKGGEQGDTVISLFSADICDDKVREALLPLGERLVGVPVDTGAILVKQATYADSLLFLHNSKKECSFQPSHLFKDKNDLALGAYAVMYEDGMVELISLYYGSEVGVKDFKYERHRIPENKKGVEIDIEIGGDDSKALPCYFTHNHQWFESLCYSTTPVITDDLTAFAYEWKNPYPEKKITKIKAINVSQDMEQTVVLYGIAAIKK